MKQMMIDSVQHVSMCGLGFMDYMHPLSICVRDQAWQIKEPSPLVWLITLGQNTHLESYLGYD